MRRPSPLPPSPTSPSGDPGESGEGASRDDHRDERAAAPRAGITPGHAESSVQPSAPDSGAVRDAPGTSVRAPEALPGLETAQHPDQHAAKSRDDSVHLRDVWGAARARRRALRAEVRRFTVRQRRRRTMWIVVSAAIVALVLVTLGAAYSPLFAVERVRVVGSSQLDEAAVEQALSGQLGTPLPLVDESAVKAVLVTFPLVETYSLEARPPHELVVRIVERTPVGVIQTAAGFTLVDAAGVALSTTPTAPDGQPVITVPGNGVSSVAFEAVGTVMRSLPEDIRAQVTAVSASTRDDVTLELGQSKAQVVWGSAEQSALKAVVLETAMTARPPESVYLYDVSSPKAIVVR